MTEENEIKEVFERLYELRHKLTSWQLQYIDSVQRQWKSRNYISEQQTKILQDIIKYS